MVRFFKWAAVLLLLMLALLIGLSVVYEQKVGDIIEKQLVTQTAGQLQFDQFDLSFVKSFPYARARLNNVQLLNKKEALGQFEMIDCSIGIWDAIFDVPTIEKAIVRNGNVQLTRTEKGWNYEMDAEKNSGSPMMVNIQNLNCENVRLTVDNPVENIFFALNLNDAIISLENEQDQSILSLDGNIESERIKTSSGEFHLADPLHLRSKIVTDIVGQKIKIEELEIAKTISITGEVDADQSNFTTDLKDAPLAMLLNFLPQDQKSKILGFKPTGLVSGTFQMNRPENQKPSLECKLTLDKGSISIPERNIIIDDIEANVASDDLMRKADIEIKRMAVDGEDWSGAIDVDYASETTVDGYVKGDLAAKTIAKLFSSGAAPESKGKIKVDKIEFDNYRINKEDQNSLIKQFKGKLIFDNAAWKINEQWVGIESGNAVAENGVLDMQRMQVAIGDSDVELSGTFREKIKNKYLVDLKAKSDKLYAEQLWKLYYRPDSLHTDSIESEIKAPRLLEGKLLVEIDELIYQDITSKDLDMDFTFDDQDIAFAGTLDVFDGKLDGAGHFEKEIDGHHLYLKAKADDWNLHQCLEESNNFGQEFITADNLSGELNSQGVFDFYWDEEFNYLKKKTSGLIGMSTTDGRLKDIDLMQQFSKFSKSEDLADIRFNTLQNYLEISGDDLYIPAMFIQNNAMNMTVEGLHSVDNKILYHIKVNAGQVLIDKIKKRDKSFKPKKDKKNGWFSMFFRVTGTTENYKYEKDKKLVNAAFERSYLRKEKIYRKLTDVFGYSEKFSTPEDWEDIPEYQ